MVVQRRTVAAAGGTRGRKRAWVWEEVVGGGGKSVEVKTIEGRRRGRVREGAGGEGAGVREKEGERGGGGRWWVGRERGEERRGEERRGEAGVERGKRGEGGGEGGDNMNIMTYMNNGTYICNQPKHLKQQHSNKKRLEREI